tara:strand:+ start:650 stop:1171 length:522 start_codon:yes stop_codon:yes gene_type:complete
MPARITHNEGTINGSKEHTYVEFILVGGGNTNHGGQVIKNFGRIKCKTIVNVMIGAGNIKGCPSSITWSASDNTKAQITSDYGFEYLKEDNNGTNNWHNDIVIAKGGEETLLIDNLTGEEVRYGDNKNKPGTCAIKILTTDYANAIVTGNPEVKTDGDYKILVWKQPGTIEAA